jgi:hypothetical protein
MDAQVFIAQIKDWSSRYKKWWFEPREKFIQEYEKDHPSFFRETDGLKSYHAAVKEFETKLMAHNDLIEEFFAFVDGNFDVYINSTPEQRRDIRIATSNSYSVNNRGSVTRFTEEILLRYVREHAIPKIQATSEKKYLLSGLVALCLENSGVDYRDTLIHLADLFIAAEDQGLEPELHFREIAEICDSEMPRGGSTPMKQLMANISLSAILSERRALKT